MSPLFHSGKPRFLPFWVTLYFNLVSTSPVCPVGISLLYFKIILQKAGSH